MSCLTARSMTLVTVCQVGAGQTAHLESTHWTLAGFTDQSHHEFGRATGDGAGDLVWPCQSTMGLKGWNTDLLAALP